MISGDTVFRQDTIFSVPENQLVTHSQSILLNRIIITSVSSSSDIFIFAVDFDNFISNVCKIATQIKDIKMSLFSPDASEIFCLSSNGTFSFISISPFISRFFSAQKLRSTSDASFPRNMQQEEIRPPFDPIVSKYPLQDIVNAHFWSPSPSVYLVILVSQSQISTLSHADLNPTPISIQLQGVISTSFRQKEKKAVIAIFSKAGILFITFRLTDTGIQARVRPYKTSIQMIPPIISQFSFTKSKWYLSILHSHLSFYDKKADNIPITLFDSSSKATSSFAVTKNFVFDSTGGIVSARFLRSVDLPPFQLAKGMYTLSVVDGESDTVSLFSANAVIIASLQNPPENIAMSLIRRGLYKAASSVCSGFQIEATEFYRKAGNECLVKGDYHRALEVFQEGKCNRNEALCAFIFIGQERLALHMLYGSSKELNERDNLLASIIWQRLRTKNFIFLNFSFFDKVFNQAALLPSPSKMLSDPNLINQKRYHPTLQCHYNAILSKEDLNLSIASKLDLEMPRSSKTSSQYLLLLRELASSIPTTEQSLSLPVCLRLSSYEAKELYISEGKLFYGKDIIFSSPISYATFSGKIYVIDKYFQPYSSPQDSINFERLLDMPPSISVKSSDNYIIFLSVSGMAYAMNSNQVVFAVRMSFVDVATFKSRIFLLDIKGIIHEFHDGSSTIFYDADFTRAISVAGDTLVALHHKSVSIFCGSASPIEKTIDIIPTFCKSGEVAIIGSEEQILIVYPDGRTETTQFSQRIGTLTDALMKEGSIIVVGSAAPPMKILREPIYENKSISLKDARAIAAAFKKDIIFSLFHTDAYRIPFAVAYKSWDDFSQLADANLIIDNILKECGKDEAKPIMHEALKRKVPLSDELLESSIEYFIETPEDIDLLNKEQLKNVFKTKVASIKPNIDSNLAMKVVQGDVQGTLVPSMKFQEGELVVFSCKHSYTHEALETELKSLTNFLSNRTQTAGEIEKEYGKEKISVQCPKCLLNQLAVRANK